jgi:hypothetical protein
MRHRAHMIGASLATAASRLGGARVTCRLPGKQHRA